MRAFTRTGEVRRASTGGVSSVNRDSATDSVRCHEHAVVRCSATAIRGGGPGGGRARDRVRGAAPARPVPGGDPPGRQRRRAPAGRRGHRRQLSAARRADRRPEAAVVAAPRGRRTARGGRATSGWPSPGPTRSTPRAPSATRPSPPPWSSRSPRLLTFPSVRRRGVDLLVMSLDGLVMGAAVPDHRLRAGLLRAARHLLRRGRHPVHRRCCSRCSTSCWRRWPCCWSSAAAAPTGRPSSWSPPASSCTPSRTSPSPSWWRRRLRVRHAARPRLDRRLPA